MIRSLTLIPAMFCAAAIVAAQAPAPERPAGAAPAAGQETTAPKPSAPSAQAPRAAAGTVTYTGCLKPGAAPGSWVLESAQSGASSSASAAKPDSAVGTSGGPKTTLNLTTKPGTELKPHADHKIEVVGMIAPAKSGADAPTGKANQEFTVESVKMVSATCP